MKQKEFLQLDGALVVKPMLTPDNHMLGWTVSRNNITLESFRSDCRIFKTLDSVSVFCKANGIESFSVKGVK